MIDILILLLLLLLLYRLFCSVLFSSVQFCSVVLFCSNSTELKRDGRIGNKLLCIGLNWIGLDRMGWDRIGFVPLLRMLPS